jgi:hypothetical protein
MMTTTKTDDTFGFGVLMNDGSELVIDTPEKLEELIANDMETTFDIIILLASRLYHEATMCQALEERLTALSGGGRAH